MQRRPAADVSSAPELIDGLQFDTLLADKGYDADWLVDLVEVAHHAEVVIPPRKGRKQPRKYDQHIYKQRNLVERLIGWIKHFRRAATRYEKTAQLLGILELRRHHQVAEVIVNTI